MDNVTQNEHIYQVGDIVIVLMEGEAEPEIAQIGAIDHDCQVARLQFLCQIECDSAGNIVAGKWCTLWGGFAYWEGRITGLARTEAIAVKAVA